MTDCYPWQQNIWEKLAKGRNFRNHAILLTGRKGIGKYEFARNMAKALLCAKPTENQRACGACASCHWFTQNSHPNFCLVAPEAFVQETEEPHEKTRDDSVSASAKKSLSQQISIEQIRQLDDFVYLTGHQQGYKIIVIYPAEAMNPSASNALLKKLEEPPENVLLILVSHQPRHLLPTIRSRCQQIAMPVPDLATSAAWLKQQGIKNPEASLACAGYSPLTALQMAQGETAMQHARFIQQISDPDRLDPLVLADALQKTQLSLVVDWLQKWCYDLLSYTTTGKVRYYIDQSVAIKALSAQMNIHDCSAFTRELNAKQHFAHHPLNPRVFLEDVLVDYARLMVRK